MDPHLIIDYNAQASLFEGTLRIKWSGFFNVLWRTCFKLQKHILAENELMEVSFQNIKYPKEKKKVKSQKS